MTAAFADLSMGHFLSRSDWSTSTTSAPMPRGDALSSPYRDRKTLSYPFENGALIVEMQGAPPPWLIPTVERLASLLDLEPNWDSYGAPRIDPATADAALRIALEAMRDDSPIPSVTPTTKGGIQFEWHTNGMDLEIEIISPKRVLFYFENNDTGDVEESEFTHDWTRLAQAVATLSD